MANGFNLPAVLRYLRTHTTDLLNRERQETLSGGSSHIALLMPNLATVSDADNSFAIQQNQILSEEAPDLRILFFAGGVATRFNRFVRDETRDIFTLSAVVGPADQSLVSQVTPVVNRIAMGKCLNFLVFYRNFFKTIFFNSIK